MPRRHKGSTADRLVEWVAVLPWWAGVALAALLYLVLHRIADQPSITAIQPGQAAATIAPLLWKTMAGIGQYLLPLICLAGAGISAWKRLGRSRLVADVVRSDAADVLHAMSWQQFERLVGEGFRLQGYTVTETGGGGADGGVDLVLSKGGEKFLVQCKQWKAFKVGVDVVRELYGAMAAKGSAGGFVVTSGRFTEQASSFASGRNISLIDGPKLQAMIRHAGTVGTGIRSQPRPPQPAVPSDVEPPSPNCPTCSKPMARRWAKRGVNAGTAFWGCTGYPSCRGTRSIS